MATTMVRVLPRIVTAVVLLSVSVFATPARAQVIVETGMLSPKTKDLGAMWDKALKDPTAAKPKPTTKKPAASRAAAVSTKPKVLPETFSGQTEDERSVLDINVDLLTRFSAALAAESARRSQDGKLTRLQYDEVGAAAAGVTPRQYFVLKERVRPFCEAIAAGQAPSNDLTLSYMPSETAAIRPRCSTLLPALKQIRSSP